MKMKKGTNVFSVSIFLALFVASSVLTVAPKNLMAASVTSFSDTLSRIKASTAANHEIKFVTPSGVSAAGAITVTFSADFTGLGSVVEDDVDFATGSSNNCTSATFTEQATDSSPSGATWGVGISGQVITITSGTGTVTADRCVRIRVGTNATSSGTGAHQISNGAADDDDSIVIGGSFGDSGTATVDIIADDQIVITATVDPTLTFQICDEAGANCGSWDNAIGFGSLSSSAARWATNAGSGSGSDTTAHTMKLATNSAGGYNLTYNGPTLTSGLNTISVASITNDADGTQGSEEFGLGISTDGNATIATGYDHNAVAGSRDWAWIASTTTTIASETGPTATETFSAYYLANISSATEAGSYTSTTNYIGTGTF
jgi:hypothetical protein